MVHSGADSNELFLRAYVGFCVVSALEVNARAWPMARGDESWAAESLQATGIQATIIS
jgi:hypothetical protein